VLYFLQKIKVLSLAVTKEEKEGIMSSKTPFRMSNPLSILTMNQLSKLNKFNLHRRKIADKYRSLLKGTRFDFPPTENTGTIWLRFPIRVKNARNVLSFLKRRNILIGNWYGGVIQPAKNLALFGYKSGSCPVAEKYSHEILNLPTYPTFGEDEVLRVVKTLKQWKA
jgi:dTDP-4-amino-4,6-dideoxygalactose transaminase